MFTIFLHRIRKARIKNILDNCFATNEIGQQIPKTYLRDEVEWYVDTYPGFPERSLRTGEYLYPLGPDPNNAPEQDVALADFRNVDHSETWGVPSSTKKRSPGFRAPLRVHMDQRILRARRTIKKKTAGDKNAVTARPALRTSSFSVRKRAASTDSKQAVTTRTLLQVMDDEPAWDGEINKVLGVFVYLFNLPFGFT